MPRRAARSSTMRWHAKIHSRLLPAGLSGLSSPVGLHCNPWIDLHPYVIDLRFSFSLCARSKFRCCFGRVSVRLTISLIL